MFLSGTAVAATAVPVAAPTALTAASQSSNAITVHHLPLPRGCVYPTLLIFGTSIVRQVVVYSSCTLYYLTASVKNVNTNGQQYFKTYHKASATVVHVATKNLNTDCQRH